MSVLPGWLLEIFRGKLVRRWSEPGEFLKWLFFNGIAEWPFFGRKDSWHGSCNVLARAGETSLDLGEADMKIETRMRRQILAGLAAILLPVGAASARAAQVDARSDAAERSSAPHSGDKKSLAANGDFTGETAMQKQGATSQVTRQESELARAAVIDTSLLGILIVGMGLIVAYATVATRRRDLQPILRNRIAGVAYRPASSSASR
jgi:hypothetical protein